MCIIQRHMYKSRRSKNRIKKQLITKDGNDKK